MILEKKKLKVKNLDQSFELPINDIKRGINSYEDFFIVKNSKDKINIFDRICDHNGGRLISKNNTNEIICPLHGWKFDANTGFYTNTKVKKKEIPFEVKNKKIIFKLDKKIPKFTTFEDNIEFEIIFLNHSCLVFKTKEFSFAIDPWIFGPAFLGGWWLKNKSPSNSLELLNSCDFIFISHNHPDHLHDLTLNKINPQMQYYVANFQSKSTHNYLKSIGKENVENLNFGSEYINKDLKFVISPLKSGDFRDDSGIYFSIGKFKSILAVDTNSINFFSLPNNITFLASSFAGGASGYPVCFDNFKIDEKKKIIDRNNRALFARNNKLINTTNPKFYMPYAGFFEEKATRDKTIHEINEKMSIEKYENFFEKKKNEILNVNKFQKYTFLGEELTKKEKINKKFNDFEIDNYLENQKRFYNKLSNNDIIDYFKNCKFNSKLKLFINLTNDDFSNTYNSFIVNFSKRKTNIEFLKQSAYEFFNKEKEKKITSNLIYASIRLEAFVNVIKNYLPWEDMLIGFQLRIQRFPDVYNSDFWYHFSNIYVKSSRKSSLSQCNFCEIILQKFDTTYIRDTKI